MLTPVLDPHVRDQVARNCLAQGKYVLISFHQSDVDPVVITQGMNEKRWNIATHEVRSVRKGGE